MSAETFRSRAPWRIVFEQAAVFLVILAIVVPRLDRINWHAVRTSPNSASATPKPVLPPKPAPESEAEPAPALPPPPPAPTLDREAIARAEGALDAARQERAKLEARLAAESRELAVKRDELKQQDQAVRALAAQLDGPAARLKQVRARGTAIQAERGKIQAELVSLAKNPHPRRKPLIDKTPVARLSEGDELHFEVRNDRVAFIDLDRLIEKVKNDAVLQMRLAGSTGMVRPISSTVGPVGDFVMKYELGRNLPSDLDEAMHARGVTYSLQGWEIVPVRPLRGETLETIQQPISNFARAVNSVRPGHATITLWVYPDGFTFYRFLRDQLHARGFQVAARPLPSGMAIRGSPAGTVSASQ